MAAFLLLAAALAAPAATEPAKAPQPEASPALVANADGSWTITRELGEAPPRLEVDDSLLLDDTIEDARDAMRAAEEERRADEAFEDAIDAARRDERPD